MERRFAGCPSPRRDIALYCSITSSASTSKLCGTVSPSALAVLRLMRSNLVGCSTGMSAGRILPPQPADAVLLDRMRQQRLLPCLRPLREQRAAVTVRRGSEVRGHVVAEKRNTHGMAGVAHPDCAGGANAVIRVGEHRLCTESDVRQVDARAGELAAKPAALQTGLRHISDRSRACRNGNWKMPSRDWRRKATGPDPKMQNSPTRDSGAPA
jgi:hypothetical protein